MPGEGLRCGRGRLGCPGLLLLLGALPGAGFLLDACDLLAPEAEVLLVLPQPPPQWRQTVNGLSWRVLIPGGGTEELHASAQDPGGTAARLPKRLNQPVLAYLEAEGGTPGGSPGGGLAFPPAAAVSPCDLSADGRTLPLSWVRGPAGELLRRLLARGLEVETLNAARLCREIEERFPEDPWRLDCDAAVLALASGSFRVTDLRPLPCRAVEVDVGQGEWFLESPFFAPLVAGPGKRLRLPAVAVGFHRLFERGRGWKGDLWVEEQRVLWIPAP
jgi:hypothetical protein